MVDRPRRIAPRDRRQALEHIEVVTPDDPTWWDDAPADSPLPTSSQPAQQPVDRRRRLLVGGLVAVALIAVATVAAVDDDTDADLPAASVGHYVIDGPGLRPYSADIVTPLPADARYALDRKSVV